MRLSDDKVIMLKSTGTDHVYPWSQKKFVEDWLARAEKIKWLSDNPDYAGEAERMYQIVKYEAIRVFDQRYKEQKEHGIPFIATRIEEGDLANGEEES